MVSMLLTRNRYVSYVLVGASPSPAEVSQACWHISKDGGGVRGLSSLHILRNVMQQLGTEEKPAKPCEVFDMIAGTSTGG